MKKTVSLIFSLGILILGACGSQGIDTSEVPPVEASVEATEAPVPTSASTPTEAGPEAMEPALPFELISTAFEQGEPIPVQYSCDGEDISPSLAWGDPPTGTQSLAIIRPSRM